MTRLDRLQELRVQKYIADNYDSNAITKKELEEYYELEKQLQQSLEEYDKIKNESLVLNPNLIEKIKSLEEEIFNLKQRLQVSIIKEATLKLTITKLEKENELLTDGTNQEIRDFYNSWHYIVKENQSVKTQLEQSNKVIDEIAFWAEGHEVNGITYESWDKFRKILSQHKQGEKKS